MQRFARPLAYGVSDPGHRSLMFYWIYRARLCMGRQGAIPRPTTTAFPCPTIFQLRLKIALFFDSLFFDFGSILGPKMAPKSQKILKKSTSKSHLNSNVFSILFFMFFLGFSTPANVKNLTKLMEGCSFLHFSSFLLRLAIGTHFRPYWTRFGSGFGVHFRIFLEQEGDRKFDDF